jgi:hypothetical protein
VASAKKGKNALQKFAAAHDAQIKAEVASRKAAGMKVAYFAVASEMWRASGGKPKAAAKGKRSPKRRVVKRTPTRRASGVKMSVYDKLRAMFSRSPAPGAYSKAEIKAMATPKRQAYRKALRIKSRRVRRASGVKRPAGAYAKMLHTHKAEIKAYQAQHGIKSFVAAAAKYLKASGLHTKKSRSPRRKASSPRRKVMNPKIVAMQKFYAANKDAVKAYQAQNGVKRMTAVKAMMA